MEAGAARLREMSPQLYKLCAEGELEDLIKKSKTTISACKYKFTLSCCREVICNLKHDPVQYVLTCMERDSAICFIKQMRALKLFDWRAVTRFIFMLIVIFLVFIMALGIFYFIYFIIASLGIFEKILNCCRKEVELEHEKFFQNDLIKNLEAGEKLEKRIFQLLDDPDCDKKSE
ncbi:MAG: hypothetical protein MHMPM18_000506 [Marteilia pararefringens]